MSAHATTQQATKRERHNHVRHTTDMYCTAAAKWRKESPPPLLLVIAPTTIATYVTRQLHRDPHGCEGVERSREIEQRGRHGEVYSLYSSIILPYSVQCIQRTARLFSLVLYDQIELSPYRYINRERKAHRYFQYITIDHATHRHVRIISTYSDIHGHRREIGQYSMYASFGEGSGVHEGNANGAE